MKEKRKLVSLKIVFILALIIFFMILLKTETFAWAGSHYAFRTTDAAGNGRTYYVLRNANRAYCPYCGTTGNSKHPIMRYSPGTIVYSGAKGYVYIAPTCTLAGGNATLYAHYETDTGNWGYWYVIDAGKEVAARGHTYGSVTTKKAATCTASGYGEKTCKKCGKVEKVTIAALGHNYSTTSFAGKDATCTEAGYKYYRCTRSGCNAYRRENIAALGHAYKTIQTVRPTCTANGYIVEECSRCHTQRKTIPGSSQGSAFAALGHNFVNGICSRPGCGIRSGSGNGSGSSSGGGDTSVHIHTWQDASCEEPEKCTSCGKTSGSALGHNYVNGVCTRPGCGEYKTEGVLNEWDLTINGLVSGKTKAVLTTDGTLTISGEGLYAIGDYEQPGSEGAKDLCPITGKSRIKKVHITGTAYNIGMYLFYYCTNLEEVIIDNPESITRIGEGAFFGCYKLKSFTMPPNVTAIGARVFCHCHDLEKLDFASAKGLERIGHEVARDCWSLKDVTLPEGLKVIGYEAFLNCIALKNIVIPSTVVAMGTKAVSANETGLGNSSQLTDAEKEKGNTKGYNNVFTIDFSRNVGQENEYKSYQELVLKRNNMSDLSELLTQTKVYYYPTNTLLGTYANQKALNEMIISPISWDVSAKQDKSISATLDTNGKLTISGTGEMYDYTRESTPWYEMREKITSVEIGEGITTVGAFLLYNNENITSVTLPSTLQEIHNEAFYGCKKLTSINIPAKVTKINTYAFSHCESLTSIIIPKGVDKLYGGTFKDCYKLNTVKVLGDIVVMGDMDFYNCPELRTYTVSPYIQEIGTKVFALDSTLTSTNKIEYYSNSKVMTEYAKANSSERTFTAKSIDELTLKTNPSNTQYSKGDTLDTEGLVLTTAYYNGSTTDTKLTKEVTEGFTCTPEKLETVGTQKITVTYGGKTVIFNVEVKELEVTDVYIKTEPTKSEYNVGDTLNTEGLTLIVIYSNNTSATITEGFTCTPTKLEKEGEQTITVSYSGKTATFTVTVGREAGLVAGISSIAVKTKPSKLIYNVGDTLDTTGLVLTATYSDGTTKDITEGFTCTPTKLEKEGIQEITVSYGETTTTFTVTVNKVTTEEPTLSSIKVKTKPSKLTYNVGDTLNTTGLVLTATYSDGTTKDISTGFTCTPTKLEKEGTQTITVSYGGKTTTFTVTVNKVEPTLSSIKVKTKPSKLTYNVGDTLNTTGLVLTATYSDGTTKDISTGFTCTPTKLEKEGTQTITVSYGGKTTTFTVTVNKVTAETVYITSDKYNISNTYITEIQPKTTLGNLKENITTNATEVKVQKNGTDLKDEEYVATGIKIILSLNNNEPIEFTLVVKGDVNGDGKADFQDIVSANKHRLGKKTLAEVYALAGDVTGDGTVDFKDIVKVNKYRLNKIAEAEL